MDTHIINITPPLQTVNVSNGCEAFSTNIYIPAKSELMATFQSITRSQFFPDFNLKYTNISHFLVWYDFKFAELIKAEVKALKAKMIQLPPMPMDMFENIIENIDEDYPCSLSARGIIVILVVMSIFMVASGVLLIWYKRKATLSSFTVGNLVQLIPPLAGNTPSLDSLLPMMSELPKSLGDTQSTSTAAHKAACDKLTLLIPSSSITGLHTTPIPLSRSTTQPHARFPDGPSNKPAKPRSTSLEDTTEPVSLRDVQ